MLAKDTKYLVSRVSVDVALLNHIKSNFNFQVVPFWIFFLLLYYSVDMQNVGNSKMMCVMTEKHMRAKVCKKKAFL
jgi:Na+/H+ antiporter NhaC